MHFSTYVDVYSSISVCTVKLAQYVLLKGIQNQYILSEVLAIRVGLCT